MIEKYSQITKHEMREVTISRWVIPKGYKLAVCDLKDTIYNQSLTVVLGTTREFRRFIKDSYDYDVDCDSALAFYFQIKKDGKTSYFMLIQENEWRASDYGNICHELHHFTHYMLDNLGLSYGLGGEEAYAYVQGYYMEQVCRAFVELKKTKYYKLNYKKK